MLHAALEPLPGGGLHLAPRRADRSAYTFGTLLADLRDRADVRAAWTRLLADEGPRAFRLELPPLVGGETERPAELVLLDAAFLDKPADPSAFAGHFAASDRPVLAFTNLGGDAQLIVPRPAGDPAVYAHLARFLREGPPAQVDELWRVVATTTLRRLRPRLPLWLNTHGGGVPWLHVRLDRRPKYYGHAPYRRHAP